MKNLFAATLVASSTLTGAASAQTAVDGAFSFSIGVMQRVETTTPSIIF